MGAPLKALFPEGFFCANFEGLTSEPFWEARGQHGKTIWP
jgi:hypothetical protein